MSCFLFFRPSSSAGSLPRSLFRLVPSISPPTLPTLRHTTASVSTDTRGTSKSFVLPPRCLPFPSPCLSAPLIVPALLFSSFFRVQIELYERVSAKVPRDERAESKSQMEITQLRRFLKSSVKFIECLPAREFSLFRNRCDGQLRNLQLKCNIPGICLQRTRRAARANGNI